MKILYTITGLSVGGAETITVNLASRMQQLGHTVKILYLSGLQEVSVPAEISVESLCMKKTPIGFVRALYSAKKIMRDFKPDVVHANMFHAILFSRVLRLFVKIPRLVCTEHSNNFHGQIRRVCEHCTDFLSDVNTNVSESATENFIRNGLFSRKKSVTVYNGIDLNRFSKNTVHKNVRTEYGISDNDFVFLNVSRFNIAKDHKNLLKAFAIVHSQHEYTKLMLVGSGELENEITSYCNELALHDAVIFAGAKSNVADFYNSADCFVLSSAWEGLPLVVAEAMACELPVVVTECAREVSQVDNWIVPAKDSEKLAEKMQEVMQLSRYERNTVGKENRNLVEKFNLDGITERWCLLYSPENQRGGD